MSTCDVEVCLDSIQYRGPRPSTHSDSTHRGLWEISEQRQTDIYISGPLSKHESLISMRDVNLLHFSGTGAV